MINWAQNLVKKILAHKIIFLGLLILLMIFTFSFRKGRGSEYSLATVAKGSIREEVSATGKVIAAESVNLSFRAAGNVSKITIKTGEKVKAGQILAYLENNDLWAQLKQAQANLEAEMARLAELEKGTRQETINIKEIELETAQQNLSNYSKTLVNTLNDSYAKAEEAIKIDIQDIFYGAEAASGYALSFSYCVSNEIASEARYLRLSSERALMQWKNELAIINSSSSFVELNSAIQKAQSHLTVFENFFNKLSNILLADCSYSNPGLDIHRTNANHGRNLINTAISNIDASENNIVAQNLSVQKIQNELNLLLAGSTVEQIAVQEARVKSAQANVSNYYALIEKTIIRAPQDGFVMKKEIQEGEVAAINTPVINVMAEEGLEIRAYIPEVDVSKIQIGNTVLITLDAFPRQEFEGKIIEVDLAETIIDGVVYYRVKNSISSANLEVKVGMTADIIIITDYREEALIIPQRAIIEKGGKMTVRIPDGEEFKEQEVETGIKSSDGNIEILSGLKEGDQVITFIKKQ